MSYNVTLLDRQGRYRTVYVAPDRAAVVTHHSLATNHQRVVEWEAYAHATATLDRERVLRARLDDPRETASRFVHRFLEPPLYTAPGRLGWGTLYTAVYEPAAHGMALYWPGAMLTQSMGQFHEAAVDLSFAGPARERTEA